MKKFMSKLFTRASMAHVLISSSIILVGIGLSILNLGIGLASAGVLCGVYGYLLGAE